MPEIIREDDTSPIFAKVSVTGGDPTGDNDLARKKYVDDHAGGSSAWGAITGTITDQADLQAEFADKVDTKFPHVVDLVNNTPKNIFSVVIAPNTFFAAVLDMEVEGFDGTDVTFWIGTVPIICFNNGGVIANVDSIYNNLGTHGKTGALNDPSTGFGDSVNISNTNAIPSVFSFNPGDLGGDFSGGFLRLRYKFAGWTDQDITFL